MLISGIYFNVTFFFFVFFLFCLFFVVVFLFMNMILRAVA